MVKEDLHAAVPFISHYFFTFLIKTVHPQSVKWLAAVQIRFAEEGGGSTVEASEPLTHTTQAVRVGFFFGPFYFGTHTRSAELHLTQCKSTHSIVFRCCLRGKVCN